MTDDRRALARRYYAYKALVSFGFVTPVFTLFLLARDLSYAQIATLSAVNWVVVTGGEVPTGYVGDRVGRRDSLLVGVGLQVASLAGFVVARRFPAFVVLYALWALGIAFRSGAESAWLYEALDARGAAGRFTAVRGRGGAVERWTAGASMVAGGLVYPVAPTLPFVAAAAVCTLGMGALLALPRAFDDPDADRLTAGEAAGVLREALARPPLRSFVLYVGLLFAAVGAADTYVQPITVAVLERPLAGLSVGGRPVRPEATLGVLYAGFAAVSAVASDRAAAVERALGRRRAVLAGPPLVGAVLLVPAVVPALAVPAFFAMRATRTVAQPIVARHLNEHVAAAGRATVLSAASMAYATLRIPLVLAGGVLADAAGPLAAVALLGGVCLLGAAATAAVESPVG